MQAEVAENNTTMKYYAPSEQHLFSQNISKCNMSRIEEPGVTFRSGLQLNKAYAAVEFSRDFYVCNPCKKAGADHTVYTVIGEDG